MCLNVKHIMIGLFIDMLDCIICKVAFKLCMIFNDCDRVILFCLNIIYIYLKYPTCTYPFILYSKVFEIHKNICI